MDVCMPHIWKYRLTNDQGISRQSTNDQGISH